MKFGTLLTAVMTIFFIVGQRSALAAEIKNISSAQVMESIKHKDAQIFDVNPLSIYKKNHVPTAKHIEYSKIQESLPANKNTKLIFYCKNEMCSASHQAAKIASESGFKDVSRMSEGIDGWLDKKMPTEVSGTDL